MKLPRIIYAIQHNVTKRIYVGSSANVENRYWNHMNNLRNHKHNIEDMQSDYDNYWYLPHGRCISLNRHFNVDFPMVKWEDDKPWLIEDLKKLEVVEINE